MNLRELNLKKTEEDLKKSVTKDVFIIQAIHTVDLLIIEINKLVSNLRERYGYYNPKSARIQDQEELIKEVKKFSKGVLGVDYSMEDKNSIMDLIKIIEEVSLLRNVQEIYIEKLMKQCCPNLLFAAGTLIGARLISIAGSMKNLAEMPSSRVQILGAEKSLFKHLRTGNNPPKFGVIFSHESIAKSDNRGKAARQLASKISIAVKKDYFSK